MKYEVAIVGAGLAGLACARKLFENNRSCIILERDDRPGGRIKTDRVDGFLLDHGFQVLQTGYPEARHSLDLARLNLKKFPSGVIIRAQGKFSVIADPRYHFRHLLSTLTAPIGSIKDRFLMAKMALSVTQCPFEQLFEEDEERARTYLQRFGFSQPFIDRFFVPFLAGACLDRNIEVSSRVLRYLVRIFASGDAALPENGMEAIPQQIANGLPESIFRFNSTVEAIEDERVSLADGSIINAEKVILATSAQDMKHFITTPETTQSIGESCLYFASDWKPPFSSPFLVLNGDKEGPVNNIAFPSLVAPNYSSVGKTLIAIVALGDAIKATDLEHRVRRQCREWFGACVDDWDHLRSYTISHALPSQVAPTPNPFIPPEPASEQLTICGEHGSLPGIQWALLSGRLAAESA